MTLTEHERQTAVWLKIKSHLDARLIELRTANDRDTNEIDTAKVRGRIAEVKALLELNVAPAALVPVLEYESP